MKEMREVFGETLVEIGRRNSKVIVLDADLNTSTRIDIFKAELPGQFIQMGIAEQNMFGWAAGLATFGLIPVPSTFAAFAAKRACDQISISIAYPKLNVKIPGSYCGISTGKAGATHQTIEDLAIMRAIPNMRVLAAADGNELEQMMHALFEYEGPVYFRVLRPAVPQVFGPDYRFDWKPVLLRPGSSIALVATGFMTHRCLAAAEELATAGIDAAVVHVPCLKPLDSDLVCRTAARCGAVVTAENHSVIGGLGSAVAEILVENCPVKMKRVGVGDTFVETGEDEEILLKYGLMPQNIVQAARDLLAGR